MKIKNSLKNVLKNSLILAIMSLVFAACVPTMVDDGSYDMVIQEISNPRIIDAVTAVDVRVTNRGCSPQELVGAIVNNSGNNIEIAIRYKDVVTDLASTCATFDQVHTVNLGSLPSGNYIVRARAQTEPFLNITVP